MKTDKLTTEEINRIKAEGIMNLMEEARVCLNIGKETAMHDLYEYSINHANKLEGK